jgi:hypothetical protein
MTAPLPNLLVLLKYLLDGRSRPREIVLGLVLIFWMACRLLY